MSTVPGNPDRLYELLPAVYRIADADNDEQLRALLALVNRQADDVRADLQRLWDDFFIETCQRWVVPYIGDLVGNVPLHDLDNATAASTAQSLFPDLAGPDLAYPSPIRLRADVARTIYYRRRKGTPAALEELAGDVTGWGARAVEFFALLDWTQHLGHLRPQCHGHPDLRSVEACDRIHGPWDTATHTADVRALTGVEGWYGIDHIGFFLWRLKAQPRTATVPRRIAGTTWRYTFSPLGQDVPLFSAGDGEPTGAGRATELSIDAPIRPAAFSNDLSELSSPRPAPPPPAPPPALRSSSFYGPEGCARLIVSVNGEPVPATDMYCTNLEHWEGLPRPTGPRIGIDVARGRLVLPEDRDGGELRVTWCEGFSADLGGGEYARGKWLARTPAPVLVSGGGNALETAIAARAPAPATVIEVTDALSYDLVAAITLAAGEALTIQAADGVRPHVRPPSGSVTVGTAGPGASLSLNGLLVEGGLRIDGDLDVLRVLHSTLVPGRSVAQELTPRPTGPSLVVAPGAAGARLNTRLEVQLAFSIVGALQIPAHVTRLWLLDCIVDGILADGAPKGVAVSDAGNASGPPAHVERSTLFGTSRFAELQFASESVFTGRVDVDRLQSGCVRFCYLPPGSATPQTYRCQPALEIRRQIDQRKKDAAASGTALPASWEGALEARIGQWLRPGFESQKYGRPDYAQLRGLCPAQIRSGAEDGSEMGVFCLLKQPQREANLLLRLEEYLPIGLEAGLVYVT
ncbi:hypothetical protein [Geodermatophilus sp. URMC 62]|uniref:hypothetical protein n=1 Tax=Geodermatophilus sp. URMC 62 TaxID=3423414 RepID=UPI00406D14E8